MFQNKYPTNRYQLIEDVYRALDMNPKNLEEQRALPIVPLDFWCSSSRLYNNLLAHLRPAVDKTIASERVLTSLPNRLTSLLNRLTSLLTSDRPLIWGEPTDQERIDYASSEKCVWIFEKEV